MPPKRKTTKAKKPAAPLHATRTPKSTTPGQRRRGALHASQRRATTPTALFQLATPATPQTPAARRRIDRLLARKRRLLSPTTRARLATPAGIPTPHAEAFDTSTDESPDRQPSARRVDYTRTLEKFFGYNYEELNNWLYQLEAIADADRWNAHDRLRNARIHLSGRARVEASAFERKLEKRGEQLTWKKFVAFLKRKFGPADPHVHYTERLIACQQGPREDVDAFTTRFRTLVFELLEADPGALSEQMQIQHFKNGLRLEFREECVRGCPQTLDEAEEAAKTGEEIWKSRSRMGSECLAIGNRPGKDTSRSTTRRGDDVDRSGSTDALLRDFVGKQTKFMEQLADQHREVMGAIEKTTAELAQMRRASIPRCDHCKKRGHNIEQCFKLHPPRAKPDAQPAGTRGGDANVHAVADGVSSWSEAEHIKVGGNEPRRVLFDSGSDVSLVSSQFLEDIGGATLTKDVPVLTVADGGTMSARGSATLPVDIGGLQYEFRFIVSDDVVLPVIFGNDFMRAVGALMDFRDGTVVIRKDKKELRIRAMSMMSEDENVKGMTAATEEYRVCAITADRYCPASLAFSPSGDRVVKPVHDDPPAANAEPTTSLKTKEDDVSTTSTERMPTKELPELTADIAAIRRAECSQKSVLFSINAELTNSQQKQLLQLLEAHSGAFATGLEEHGRLDGVTHSIDTGNHRPVSQPPRRLAPSLLEEAQRQIDAMLTHGIIRESTSPWASPILFADKKGGDKRFCADYRLLNALTMRDRYPLPRIDDSLDILGGNKFFTCLDLQAGYWQIRMAPGDVAKTAFICPLGLYEFLVMPFGLCNAPSTFQRAMDLVLAGAKWRTCLVYLDDILVFAPTFELHLARLGDVLGRIEKHGLKLKPSKCAFGQTEVSYLGHIVSVEGIRVNPEKVQAVTSLARPTTKKLLRSFLGLTSYYRRFIDNYAAVAQPLTKLLRDDQVYDWGPNQETAFATLKTRLSTAPILAYPDWSQTFLLQTDASNTAIAAVLSQMGSDGLEHVIGYASRVLQDRECRYDTREKELLAVVYGCETFRHYLAPSSFIVITDHANLKWLMSSTKISGRLARWILQLQDFVFEVRHKPGRANRNADALSRLPTVLSVCAVRVPSVDDLRVHQMLDPQLHAVRQYLSAVTPSHAPPEVMELLRDRGTLSLEAASGLLCYTTKDNRRGILSVPYLAPVDRLDAITAAHALPISGHFGREKTYEKLRSQYYWKGMS